MGCKPGDNSHALENLSPAEALIWHAPDIGEDAITAYDAENGIFHVFNQALLWLMSSNIMPRSS